MHNRTLLTGALVAGLLAATPAAATPHKGITLQFLGRYTTGAFDAGASEITAYDAKTRRVFVVNAQDGTVDVLDIRDPRAPKKAGTLQTPGANSVAVKNGLVAVAQQADDKTKPGTVGLFSAATLKKLRSVTVGALPDMLTFTPDGSKVLVANEGEPSGYCDGDVDPEGSISIVDVRRGSVKTAGFTAYIGKEDRLRAQGIRIYGPRANAAQDFEPEYITTDRHGRTAWVSLQENNALAIVDLRSGRVEDVVPLGLKDHNRPGGGLDASDKDGRINIVPRPVKGMYQPDALASYESHGRTYLVTANEGDARDWECFAEEVRVKDLKTTLPDALKADAELGRLTVTSTSPKNAEGVTTELHAIGARSVSVRDAEGRLVWDSGDQIERLVAKELPAEFNADQENKTFDSRSDNKGPEPEGVAVGDVRGRTYAFAGLERVGGVVAFDVTDPRHPEIADYVNSRNFAGDVEAGTGGDSGPEGVLFVPASDSPTHRPLLVVGHEISGTTAIYEIR
ncbi:alkaline phosphatase [Herbidospora sp. NEAU-GS84]|uniref:Alkaline phosphatase n=1 Tax=Herbidospora solisilvae TaxID=2696284 RepID=A0A7C9J1I8_9ACTN|nr:choice-of-anchor I family protein [Herbidospora solisilvae]NAS21525.1 alkaline phosphatase [Herbidospora solisilvae]